MAFFTNEFLTDRRDEWLKSIVGVGIKANGKWYDGKIEKKMIENGSVIIDATFPDIEDMDVTVQATRLIDRKGKQCAYQEKNFQKTHQQNLWVRTSIPIQEG